MATSFPTINPTGANGFGLPASSGAILGETFQSTGGPGNYNYGNSANPNPVNTNMWGSSTPNLNVGGGGGGAGTGSSGVSNFLGLPGSENYTGAYADFSNELGKIYGRGVGGALNNFLQSGGGYNSPLTEQAVHDQIAAMQNQIQMGWGNISTQLGQTGISPNSSVAALAESNYFSNAVAQENAITAQEFYNMWNQSMGNETGILGDVLGGAQTRKLNQPGLMDWLNFGINTAGSIFGF